MTCYAVYNMISKIIFKYGTKIILELNSFCLQNNVMLKNGEDVCDRAYFVNFLNDSELLNLGFTFNHCLRIDKNNTLSIFMLSGSIPFPNSISV